jgi:hypothetical protein
VAFINCRSTLTKVLGAVTGEKGSKGGGGQVRLPDVDTGRLSRLKYKLNVNHKLRDATPDHVRCQFETAYQLVL